MVYCQILKKYERSQARSPTSQPAISHRLICSIYRTRQLIAQRIFFSVEKDPIRVRFRDVPSDSLSFTLMEAVHLLLPHLAPPYFAFSLRAYIVATSTNAGEALFVFQTLMMILLIYAELYVFCSNLLSLCTEPLSAPRF